MRFRLLRGAMNQFEETAKMSSRRSTIRASSRPARTSISTKTGTFKTKKTISISSLMPILSRLKKTARYAIERFRD